MPRSLVKHPEGDHVERLLLNALYGEMNRTVNCFPRRVSDTFWGAEIREQLGLTRQLTRYDIKCDSSITAHTCPTVPGSEFSGRSKYDTTSSNSGHCGNIPGGLFRQATERCGLQRVESGGSQYHNPRAEKTSCQNIVTR